MTEKRELLRHFLAALAYRTQKALRDAPADFGTFRAAGSVRTPTQLVRHMTSVLGYARTFVVGGAYWPDPLPSLQDEVARFHEMLEDLSQHLQAGTPLRQGMTAERLLQGPFSDAMTHAGQLALLRRLADAPVAPENFIVADIRPERLGPEQAAPVGPDEIWPEAPAGWKPRSAAASSASGGVGEEQAFWDHLARLDPLWAILSDPTKTGRRWDLRSFLETGRREVSLLVYQLRALGIDVRRDAALDFGCGVGRLSQPLASHFDRVVGVDVSPEMIRLANEINRHPARVRYVCNTGPDLAVFASGEFTFMYSNLVLQHIEPAGALRYLGELFRVVAPGGVLVFQLPSHPRPAEQQRSLSAPMEERAYRAAVQVESEVPQSLAPGSEIVLAATVTNASDRTWSQAQTGPIRIGNHWLAGSGRAMLIQDDGRAALPEQVAPGQTCRVALRVTLPREPGEYQLECDVVHEGISWFADKGSGTWRGTVRVAGSSAIRPPDEASESEPGLGALVLPHVAPVEEPAPLPMHGVHRERVEKLIAEHDAAVVHLEPDERCGREWVGYRYYVRKLS